MSMGLDHRGESFQASLNVHSGCFDNVCSRSLNSCIHGLSFCLNRDSCSQNSTRKINQIQYATGYLIKNNTWPNTDIVKPPDGQFVICA